MATASGASPAALRFARLLFGVAAVVGFSVVVYLAWIPVPQAVSHFAVEDIGYYLTAARNVANGNGVTLDGHNATNGFHPLWLALLCLEAWPFKGSPETLFHLALTTCAMFFGATCLVVYRDVRSRMIAWLAPPVAALLLCNYRLASIALGGLETALVGFSTIVTISFIARSDGAFTLGRAAGLGALLGAASLSRMDALLFGGIVLAWLGCRALPAGPARTGAIVGVAGAAMLATLIPWFVFSETHVHAWLPRSGEAIQIFTRSPWARPWSRETLHAAVRQTIVGPWGDLANVVGIWPQVNAARMTHVSGAMTLAAAGCVLAGLAWRVRGDPLVRRLAWIPAYAAAIALYYCQFPSNHLRYLYPAALSMIYFSAAVIAASIRAAPDDPALVGRVYRCTAMMLIVATLAGVGAYRSNVATAASHLGQGVLLDDLATWLADRAEPSARVGSFNAGLISYFSGRTTVNLDGVMNDNAIAALRSGTLCDYIDREDIRYIADNRLAVQFFFDADRSCLRSSWRSRWQIVQNVKRSIDTTADLQEFVVMRRR